jgi:hypothetical protein
MFRGYWKKLNTALSRKEKGHGLACPFIIFLNSNTMRDE